MKENSNPIGISNLLRARRRACYCLYRRQFPQYRRTFIRTIGMMDRQLATKGSVVLWWLNNFYDWNFDTKECPEGVEVDAIGYWDRMLRTTIKQGEIFPGKEYGELKILCWRHKF